MASIRFTKSHSCFKGTGSRLSACSLIKLFFFQLITNPIGQTHYMYLSDLRVYFKVEVYLRVT